MGLESAAMTRSLGMKVILVETAGRILERVAGEQTAEHFRQLHRDHGVEILEEVKLEYFVGDGGHLTRAVLGNGRIVDTNMAIVGIGVRPNDELACTCNLETFDGIKVDAFCRTSDPDVYAIGDCASFSYAGTHIRLESVGNATDQAEAAARSIAGDETPYLPKPRFWSDQYDTKLQIAGLSSGHEAVVARGGNRGVKSLWYYKGGSLIAVDAINDPRSYMVAVRLLEKARSPAPELIADLQRDIGTLLAHE